MSEVMVDVMLHINEKLQQPTLDAIKDNLLNLDGVSTAFYNSDMPYLMMVEYDPETINSLSLLETVWEQGIDARLVGL